MMVGTDKNLNFPYRKNDPKISVATYNTYLNIWSGAGNKQF
jgi:hypothetical protein